MLILTWPLVWPEEMRKRLEATLLVVKKPETTAANHNNIARKISNMACIGPWSVTKSTGKKSHTGKRCVNNFWIMGIGNTHMTILDIHKHMCAHTGT